MGTGVGVGDLEELPGCGCGVGWCGVGGEGEGGGEERREGGERELDGIELFGGWGGGDGDGERPSLNGKKVGRSRSKIKGLFAEI